MTLMGCATVRLSDADSVYDFPVDNLIEYGLSKEYMVRTNQFIFDADSSYATTRDSLYVFERAADRDGRIRYYLIF